METLYRVEHKSDRLGPWVPRPEYDREAVVSYSDRKTGRSPSDGPGWDDDGINFQTGKGRRICSKPYVTFVRSIDELKMWFAPTHLRRLRQAKFVVGEYRLPPRWIKHGTRQAAGLRYKGEHVRDIPLTNILKGKLG